MTASRPPLSSAAKSGSGRPTSIHMIRVRPQAYGSTTPVTIKASTRRMLGSALLFAGARAIFSSVADGSSMRAPVSPGSGMAFVRLGELAGSVVRLPLQLLDFLHEVGAVVAVGVGEGPGLAF